MESPSPTRHWHTKLCTLGGGDDLNLPDINWPDCTIQGHSYPSDINKRFLDMLITIHTEQIITTPTRQNNIDIFITNRPSLTSQCRTIPGLGDHHAISIHSSAQAHRAKPTRRKIHLWRRADIDTLKQDARSFTASFIQTYTIDSSIHTMWHNIKSNLIELQEQHVPTNSRRHASSNLGSPQKSNAYPAANNELTTYVETNQPPPENTGNTGNYKNRQNNSANLPISHISTT